MLVILTDTGVYWHSPADQRRLGQLLNSVCAHELVRLAAWS